MNETYPDYQVPVQQAPVVPTICTGLPAKYSY